MPKAKNPKLPKTVYVKFEKENNGGDTFLVADETPDSFEDGETVGVYELKETKTKRVSHELA